MPRPPPQPEGLKVYHLPGSLPARDPAALEAYRDLRSSLDDGELLVGWSFTGHLSHLSRDTGLPLGSCPSSLGGGQLSCLLERTLALTGAPSWPASLALERQRRTSRSEKIRLKHTYEGIPVLGGGITFTLGAEGQILSLRSTLLPDLRVELGVASSVREVLDTFNEASVRSTMEGALNREVIPGPMREVIWVDRRAREQLGRPAFQTKASATDEEREWSVILDGVTGEVLHLSEISDGDDQIVLESYVSFPDEDTTTDCWDTPTYECDSGYTCSEHYSEPGTSSGWEERCVQYCDYAGGSQAEKNAYCQDAISQWDEAAVCAASDVLWEEHGYCGVPYGYLQGESVPAPITLFSGGTWSDPIYQSHLAFNRIQAALTRVENLHSNILDTGGWSDGRDYCVQLLYNNMASSEMSACNEGASAKYDRKCVEYCTWMVAALGAPHTWKVSQRHQTLSHEFGHWLLYENVYNPPALAGCLDEAIPDIFGALLSAKVISPSTTWSSGNEDFDNTDAQNCWGYDSDSRTNGFIMDASRTRWRNYSCGLDSCCSPTIPYSHRSYFDYLPCEDGFFPSSGTSCYKTDQSYNSGCLPYKTCLADEEEVCEAGKSNCRCGIYASKYINRDVWTRFVQLLAVGDSELPSGETIGWNFDGVDRDGYGCAAQIIYDAIQYLQTGDGLPEWISALMQAASDNNTNGDCYQAKATMERALEASGFPERRWEVGMMDEIDVKGGKVSGVYWKDWIRDQKYFWAYVDDDDSKVKVRYQKTAGNPDGEDKVIYNGSIIGKPIIAVFNDVLYVVWTRDGSPDEVQYRYMYDNGTNWVWAGSASNPLTLPQGKASPLERVAMAADDDAGLAIAYVDSSTNYLCVTRCQEGDGKCTASSGYGDWSDKDCGPSYQTSKPKIAAVWARNINGVDPTQASDPSLYVLATFHSASDWLSLRRGHFDSSGDLTWEYTKELPDHEPYPSSETTIPPSITWRGSAFAGSSDLNYLMLLWTSSDTSPDGRKYLSVVQNLGEKYGEELWITLPADLYLDELGDESYASHASFVSGYHLDDDWDYMMGIIMTEDVDEPGDNQVFLMTNRYRY